METLDHSTLVTATGGYGWHGGSPPFVPEGYVMPAPRWAAAAYEGYAPYSGYGGGGGYAGYAPVVPVRYAPVQAVPASWYRSGGRW